MYGMLKGVEIIVPEELDTIHAIYAQIVEGNLEGRSALEKMRKSNV